MSLQQWVENAWATETKPTARGVSDFLAIADREIADASLEGMSPDGRFDHAYEAVRNLCEVMVYAGGYVLNRERKHERTILSLKFTLAGKAAERIDYLDRCRRLRHTTHYERANVITVSEADKLLETAEWLRGRVQAWLQDKCPGLIEQSEA